jgi:hypothetical protein
MPDTPLPRYSLWQAIGVALSLATRAIEEVRAGGKPGPQGEPGEPGTPGEVPYVGEVCGLFDPARDYRKFDLVAFGGSEWRARRDNPGALPGDGWALSASAGKTGQKGEIGKRGERGPAGPVIVGWTVRDFAASPILSDGSTGPALDLRALFEQYHAEAAE